MWGGGWIGRWKEAVDKRGWGKPFNKGDTVKSWGLRKITRKAYTEERNLSLEIKDANVEQEKKLISKRLKKKLKL